MNIRIVLLALAMTACSLGDSERQLLSHEAYADSLAKAGLDDTRLGRAWTRAAREALREPATTGLPHHESGAFFAHEARSAGYAFDAVGNQRLRLSLTLAPESNGRLFVDVFLADDSREPTRYERVSAATGDDVTAVTLEPSGRYVVRLQPELLATVVYDLRIELDAALPFPVRGSGPGAVGSFFGDPRDAGRRRHEGVDIFARRSTPLIAVADGVATTRRNSLGGNTVWLRGGRARYYYAHLEQAAFEGRLRVSVGDVLGYVGNSGNASSTPPHLHFAVYGRYRGAMDPLPRLLSFTFSEEPAEAEFSARHVETTASGLNMRSAPRIERGNVLVTLPAASVGRVLARSGTWLRIRTAGNREGWIHSWYQHALSAEETRFSLPAPLLAYGDPSASRDAIHRIEAGRAVRVFARHDGAVLVGVETAEPLGWLLPAPNGRPAGPKAAGGRAYSADNARSGEYVPPESENP